MDSWTEKHLKAMSFGGNKNLFEFFKIFDLNNDSLQTRYKSKAAIFYRAQVTFLITFKLKSMVDGTVFNEEKPSYDLGREVEEESFRSPNEIMNNNPPF